MFTLPFVNNVFKLMLRFFICTFNLSQVKRLRLGVGTRTRKEGTKSQTRRRTKDPSVRRSPDQKVSAS